MPTAKKPRKKVVPSNVGPRQRVQTEHVIVIKDLDILARQYYYNKANPSTPQERKNINLKSAGENTTNRTNSSSANSSHVALSTMHNIMQSVGEAIGDTVVDMAESSVSKYFKMNDDYVSNNYVTNIKDNISTIKSISKSAVTSFVSGSALGGPIAGAAIAVTNASITFAKSYYEYQKQMTEYKTALNTTNIETEFRQSRAGLYNGGRGTEN